MNDLLWWFGQNTLATLLMIPCVILACRLFRERPANRSLRICLTIGEPGLVQIS